MTARPRHRRLLLEARVRQATGLRADRDPVSTRSILLLAPRLPAHRDRWTLPRSAVLPGGRRRAYGRLVLVTTLLVLVAAAAGWALGR